MKRRIRAAVLLLAAVPLAAFGGWMVIAGLFRLAAMATSFLFSAKPILAPSSDAAARAATAAQGRFDVLPPHFLALIGGVVVYAAIRLAAYATESSPDLSSAASAFVGGQGTSRTRVHPSIAEPRFAPFATLDDALEAWNDGLKLMAEGRHATAATIFRRLAEDHIAGAALVLAQLLEDGGPDLPPDRSEARQWYEIALDESDDAVVRVSLGLFLVVEADRGRGDTARENWTRGIELLWEAVERGMPETLATLSLLHLFAAQAAPEELEKVELAAAEANRRGLLLGEFIEARLLKARGYHARCLWRTLSCIRKSRAMAKIDPRDFRLVGLPEFARGLTGDESGSVVRFLGLKDTSSVANRA